MRQFGLLLQLLLLLHCCSSNAAAAAADADAAQHTVCQLVLHGHSTASSSSSSSSPGDVELTPSSKGLLSCTPDTIPVGVTSNITGLEIARSAAAAHGIHDLNEDCKEQAATLLYTPVLFFCGNYSITLTNPVVHGIGRASANATAASSLVLLAFGGQVKAAISNGSFVDNRVGAVVLLLGNASLVVNSSSFSSNTLNGSCITAAGDSSVVVDNSTFTNNNASPPAALVALDGGAALRIAGSAKASCNACVISGNKAEGWGGGVRTLGSARLTMRSCLLSNNSAQQGGSLWAGEDSRVSSPGIEACQVLFLTVLHAHDCSSAVRCEVSCTTTDQAYAILHLAVAAILSCDVLRIGS
jgi:hypothetical protein